MLFIYKLHKDGDINFYIGSTDNMNRRANEHKSDCKLGKYYVHRYIQEHGGWDSWTMTIIGECGDDREGEKEMIKELQPSLNGLMYDFDPVAYSKAHNCAYYQANKDKLKAYHQANYEANKEHILARKKAYHEANKDKLNKKTDCPCGGKYTRHRLRHFKTKIHLDYEAFVDSLL